MVLIVVFDPARLRLQIVVAVVEGAFQHGVSAEVLVSCGGTGCRHQRARRAGIVAAVDRAGHGVDGGGGGRSITLEPPVQGIT